MSKTGKCTFCGQATTIASSQCVFICRFCNSRSMFLCHVLPEPKDPMHIRCKECKSMFSLYNCPKCQAFAVIKDFKSGKMYNCLCGFQATMVSCNQCTALLCLPNRKNYEMTVIRCKKCESSFRYRICPMCGECNYHKPQGSQDLLTCFNEACPRSQKESAKLEPNSMKVQHEKIVQGNPYDTISYPKVQSQNCNICLNREKCMINTTCFHLSVCQQCSIDLNGRCPICRTIGAYKKIFRS